jgi:hypothetical protein
MQTAILLAGRIKGWQYCKESLKRLQDKYNAVFFVSLNAEGPDESSIAFCTYFNVNPEQIVYIPTQTPEKYRQFHGDGREHNYYSQWFHIKNAFDLCQRYCNTNNMIFNLVIKYRADIQTDDTLYIENIIPKRFYCPVDPAHQTNDQIAYGDFQMMYLYSRLVDLYEFFYANDMLRYGNNKQHVKPTELVLYDYLNILAKYEKIDVIYISFNFHLDDRRSRDEPFILNPSLD